MSKSLDALRQAETALKKAVKHHNNVRANRRILCCCGKYHRIKDIDLIVTHFYVHPHGCTGGDYWLEGEWNFVCPNGVHNRLLFNDYDLDYGDRTKVGKSAEATFKHIYRHLFKSITDEYKEGGSQRPNNLNYYVNSHRRKFELPEGRKKRRDR